MCTHCRLFSGPLPGVDALLKGAPVAYQSTEDTHHWTRAIHNSPTCDDRPSLLWRMGSSGPLDGASLHHCVRTSPEYTSILRHENFTTSKGKCHSLHRPVKFEPQAMPVKAESSLNSFEPYPEGWFHPDSEHTENLIEQLGLADIGLDYDFVSHLLEELDFSDVDKLYDEFFMQDPHRRTYGVGVDQHRRPTKQELRPVKHPNDTDVVFKAREQKWEHAEKERKRRDRHFEFQLLLHMMCPEICHQLATKRLEVAKKREAKSPESKSHAAKGPGKDDQLLATLYMVVFSAILVQAEHEARKMAQEDTRYWKMRHDAAVEEEHQKGNRIRVLEARLGKRDSPTSNAGTDNDFHNLGDASPSKRRRVSSATIS